MSGVDLRFAEGFALPPVPGVETHLVDAIPGFGDAWAAVRAIVPGATLEPLFAGADGLEVDVIADLVDAARMIGDAAPDLLRWFAVECPDDVADAVAPLAAALPLVEWAEPRPVFVPASLRDGPVSWGTNPRARHSPIRRAPAGVDALHAWRVDGGTGMGVRVALIDDAWALGHEELLTARITAHSVFPLDSPPVAAVKHGTSAAGIVVAADNGRGTVGVAPDAELLLLTRRRGAAESSLAKAIVAAGHAVGRGGIVLIEHAASLTPAAPTPDVPAECNPAIHAAIAFVTSSAIGAVVVEPAGNDGADLDDPAAAVAGLDLALPKTSPSGAVIVGGGEPNIDPAGWRRAGRGLTSFGSRVDCFAVASGTAAPSGPGASDYQSFMGTSCATAVVAGVAASIQGMAVAAAGRPLLPHVVRSLLRDRTLGTPVVPGTSGVGAMPDLRRIARSQRWPRVLPVAAQAVGADGAVVVQLDDEDRVVRRELSFFRGWRTPLRVVAPTAEVWPAQPTAVVWDDPTAPGVRTHLLLVGGEGGVLRFWWDSRAGEGGFDAISTSSGDTVAPGTTPDALLVDGTLVIAGIDAEAGVVVLTGAPLDDGFSGPRLLDDLAQFRRSPRPSLASVAPATAELVAVADHGALLWFHGTAPLATSWSGPVVEPTFTSFVPGAGQAALAVGGRVVVAAVGVQGWLHVVELDPSRGAVPAAFGPPVVVDTGAAFSTVGPLAVARLTTEGGDFLIVAGIDTEGGLRTARRPAAGGAWTPTVVVPGGIRFSELGGAVAVTSPDLGVLLFAVGADGRLRMTSTRTGVDWDAPTPVPDAASGPIVPPVPAPPTGILKSQLFAGDPVLLSIAQDRDRISRIRNTPGDAVRRIQEALLGWDPGCLPLHGADGSYGDETAGVVARFKRDELRVPAGQIIDDVGPATVRRLDELQAAREQPAGTPTTVRVTDEYGSPLAGLDFSVTTADIIELVTTDAAGRASVALTAGGRIDIDPGSAFAAVGDLLDRPWPPPALPPTASVVTPAAPSPVAVQPGDDLELVVATRARLTARLVAPLAGTVRVEGRGLRLAIDPDGAVTLAVQSSGGSAASVFVDPDAGPVPPLPEPGPPVGWNPLGTYTVRAGDTEQALAAAFVGDPDAYSLLSDHPPVPGELLTLPETPGWLRLAVSPPAPTAPALWFTASPDDLVAAILADGDPGPLMDVAAVLDRPPAPQPDPAVVFATRAQSLAAVLGTPGAPLGADREPEEVV